VQDGLEDEEEGEKDEGKVPAEDDVREELVGGHDDEEPWRVIGCWESRLCPNEGFAAG
jgi:hypothetical protein